MPQRQVTQEQISLSLIDILRSLVHHVPPERRPQIELLLQVVHEKPDQQQKVKEQMLLIGGPDALKRAVAAVVQGAQNGANGVPPASAPSLLEAANPQETLPLPPLQSTMQPVLQSTLPSAPPQPTLSSAPQSTLQSTLQLANTPTENPDLPMQALQAIFGVQGDAEELKNSLIHSFHCFEPACSVAGCVARRSKLSQLQQHVASCPDSGCILCRIWANIKCMQPSLPQPAAPSFSEDRLGARVSEKLQMPMHSLPSWGGRTSMGGVAAAAAQWPHLPIDESLARRGQMSATSSWMSQVGGLPLPSVGAPSAASCSSSTSYIRAGGLSAPLPLPSFDFSQAAPIDGEGSGSFSRKRNRAVEVASAPAKKSSTFASTSGTLHVPLIHSVAATAPAAAFAPAAATAPAPAQMIPSLPSLSGFPLEKSRSTNLSANLNLAELLKSSSVTDLGLTLGLNSIDSFGDLDVAALSSSSVALQHSGSFTPGIAGISLSKCKSALRCLNVSELSLSGFLNDELT